MKIIHSSAVEVDRIDTDALHVPQVRVEINARNNCTLFRKAHAGDGLRVDCPCCALSRLRELDSRTMSYFTTVWLRLVELQ